MVSANRAWAFSVSTQVLTWFLNVGLSKLEK